MGVSESSSGALGDIAAKRGDYPIHRNVVCVDTA